MKKRRSIINTITSQTFREEDSYHQERMKALNYEGRYDHEKEKLSLPWAYIRRMMDKSIFDELPDTDRPFKIIRQSSESFSPKSLKNRKQSYLLKNHENNLLNLKTCMTFVKNRQI